MFGQSEIQNEIVRRRDMREVFTFTIDPADAKDFDDAISFEVEEDGNYQIGVHIADVSFYVRPGTQIDDEAYQRGTSVYLVDRVIPMLPEELCNDKCSLKPGEDKLCMSVVFLMDRDARVLKHKICRTVIRSDMRLDYDQAQAIIESTEDRIQNTDQISQAIRVLNDLALKMRAERIKNGALTIEQDETRFKLDAKGNPTEIYFEKPNEAHHLIEEFMLLANRTVAKEAGSGRPFVYRVHDLPDYEKLEEIKKFKRTNGRRVQGESMQRVIDMLTIRAQAKAVYSTYNIGHYGLTFSHYTHFTSPIRRYPDLMVHRLVEKYILTGRRVSGDGYAMRAAREELEMMCEHCSACEQDAAQAERDSIKLFQAMWMNDQLGKVFDGHITSIMDFGFFVQLDENHCEGLVRMELIEHPEDFVLGDPVRVQVIRVDINRAQIDFEFA